MTNQELYDTLKERKIVPFLVAIKALYIPVTIATSLKDVISFPGSAPFKGKVLYSLNEIMYLT